MAFMLKLRWDIEMGREGEFRTNQEALCTVMLEHPGVICYHADYPSERVSEWVEIYTTNEAFKAHLANEKGKEPLAALIDACSSIECRCWGDPDEISREILTGFGTIYQSMANGAFVLNPRADKHSLT